MSKRNHDNQGSISPSEAAQKAYEHLGSNASCELDIEHDRVRSVSADGHRSVLFHDHDDDTKGGPHIHLKTEGETKDTVYQIND